MDSASKSIDVILNSGEYVPVAEWMPIFDEHDEYDREGKLVRKFSREELEKIVATSNARVKAGNFAPIGPGHTVPDPNYPEAMQPAVWGYGVEYKVDRFGPDNKLGILARVAPHKSHADNLKEFPRPSIELYEKGGYIDRIAFLRRAPARDLGVLAYSKSAQDSFMRSMAPWRDEVEAFTSDKRPLAAKVGKDGKLRYAMDFGDDDGDEPAAKPADPAAPAAADKPGLPPEQHDELPPDEKQRADSYMRYWEKNHPMIRYMCQQYQATQQPSMPGIGNVQLPGQTDDMARMQRENERKRMAADTQAFDKANIEARLKAVEEENARLKAKDAESTLRYQRSEAESLVRRMHTVDRLDLDPTGDGSGIQALVDKLAPLTPEQRDAECAIIKRYARKIEDSIVGPMVNVGGGQNGKPDEKVMYGGLTAGQHGEVIRYMRENQVQYPAARKQLFPNVPAK